MSLNNTNIEAQMEIPRKRPESFSFPVEPEEQVLNERITLRIPTQLKQGLGRLKHLGVNQQAWIRQIVCQELKKLLHKQ